MITEVGQVTALDADGVWLKTIQQSTCNACSARNGCGQKLLNQFGVSTASLWASYDPQFTAKDNLSVGDWVEVSLEEGAVVLGSLLAYGLPIAGLVAGAALGGSSNLTALLGAVMGLITGALLSRYLLRNRVGVQFFQPTVVATASPPQRVAIINE